jgi:hypothetical protein
MSAPCDSRSDRDAVLGTLPTATHSGELLVKAAFAWSEVECSVMGGNLVAKPTSDDAEWLGILNLWPLFGVCAA